MDARACIGEHRGTDHSGGSRMKPVQEAIDAVIGEPDFDPDALEAKYLAERDKRLRDDGTDQYVEVTAEAEQAYVDEVRSLASAGSRFYSECTPGYYNSEGMADNRRGFFSDTHGAGPIRFHEMLAEWRNTGTCDGMEFR